MGAGNKVIGDDMSLMWARIIHQKQRVECVEDGRGGRGTKGREGEVEGERLDRSHLVGSSERADFALRL